MPLNLDQTFCMLFFTSYISETGESANENLALKLQDA